MSKAPTRKQLEYCFDLLSRHNNVVPEEDGKYQFEKSRAKASAYIRKCKQISGAKNTMSGLKSAFNKLLGRKKMSESETFDPCTDCEHKEACKIDVFECRFKVLKRQLVKQEEHAIATIGAQCIKHSIDSGILADLTYEAGYIKAVKDYAYWRGGRQYVGHIKPVPLSIILDKIKNGTIKIC